ncbi:hypothetical protein EW146_g9594 [Bondarzewia mesenterica]|uniref:Uncharacterized protein n=1 Tax=Bondarzewia mesenterica TaxID=1095465 RepID=A0A4S4L6C2_9AGAM|nr:hypothetical protein EW146_g9594 [Bondarzewia mesenterica]
MRILALSLWNPTIVNQEYFSTSLSDSSSFKSGDYPTAIGHYTTAVLAKDPTYPLNRAAAYLKLGKNEDAERDCGKVLSPSLKNVKALLDAVRLGLSCRSLQRHVKPAPWDTLRFGRTHGVQPLFV